MMVAPILTFCHKKGAVMGAKSAPIIRNGTSDGNGSKGAPIPLQLGAAMGAFPSTIPVSLVSRQLWKQGWQRRAVA